MNEDNFVLSKRSILLLLTANLKYFDFVLSKRSILLFLTANLKYFKTVESRLRCNNNENLHILTMLELLSGIFFRSSWQSARILQMNKLKLPLPSLIQVEMINLTIKSFVTWSTRGMRKIKVFVLHCFYLFLDKLNHIHKLLRFSRPLHWFTYKRYFTNLYIYKHWSKF